MRPYTIITKEIIKFKGNSKLSDIYIYACLYNSIDHKTGISKYNQETLAKKYNIPERTLRNAIFRLSNQDNILKIEQKTYHKNNDIIKKNYYYMNTKPENYFFLYDDFFVIDIDREIKGFILLLKAICYNNTNTFLSKKLIKGNVNKSELSQLIGIARKTLDKYLKLAIELELIEIIEDKIIIINEYIPLRVKENSRQSEIVRTIQDLCIKYKSEMPYISNNDLKRIEFYYPFLESQIEEIKKDNFTKIHSLRYVLNNRMKSLPNTITIKYIFSALNIPYKVNKEPMKYNNIIVA
ncbi:MAG: hypothetical protein ACLVKO_01355 [Dysgonomonas sp.]